MKRFVVILLIMMFSLGISPALAADDVVSRSIVVQSVEGSDIVLTKGTDKKYAAKAGARLASGYTIATGKDSYAWLRLDDNSTVKMNASTKLDVSNASGKELKLTVINGSISFNAGQQSDGNKTSVKAGNSTMGLRGTLFTITYIDGVMYVTLIEGTLEGSTPDGVYILEAGNILEVSDVPDDITNVSDIRTLSIDELDLNTLETIKENKQFLIDNGIIAEETFERIDELIETNKAEEERKKEENGEENQEGNQEENGEESGGGADEPEKIFLPESESQAGGNTGVPNTPITHSVIFMDYDGRMLKAGTVTRGASAVPPAVPERDGYEFIGWDTEFTYVTSDLIITAQYRIVPVTYTVAFFDYDEVLIKTETVEHGASAAPPDAPERDGYVFIGWDTDFENVTSDLTVTALYSNSIEPPPVTTYTVAFFDYDDTELKTEIVEHGASATPPDAPERDGYVFTGWDTEFINVTSDLIVTALYETDDPVITASFTDANFLAEVRTIVGKSTDDIRLSDVFNISNLNISNNNITNLSGIEHFTALEQLICSYNQLTVLDVTNNQALTYLDCANNEITSLNVSENAALTQLMCRDNNLTALNVSSNPALNYLDCSVNAIGSLNVLNNRALMQLICHSNELTGLDVTNNTALTGLNCANNYIASIAYVTGWMSIPGLTQGTSFVFDPQKAGITDKFTDPAFLAAVRSIVGKPTGVIFDIDVSGITEMDVSSKGIASLAGIEYFTSLETLRCQFNVLTELDVSGNTALSNLFCNSNALTELNVTNNPALTMLDCSSNEMTALDVRNNLALESLMCNNNELTELNVRNNAALIYFSCADNELTELDISNNMALTWLDCRNNYMTSIDDVIGYSTIPGLSSFQFNPQKPIDITDKFTDPIFLAAVRTLVSKPTGEIYASDVSVIPTLDVSGKGIASLAGIEYFTGLKQLWCYNNELTELDVTSSPALTTLSCYDNALTELRVTNNAALSSIHCNNNELTGLDVTNNTALTWLDCRDNYMTSTDDVIGWDTIPGLTLGYSFVFDPQALEDITDKFTDPKFLAEVRSIVGKPTDPIYNTDVSGIPTLDVSGKGITSLAGIEYFTGLKQLWCYNNELTELDVTSSPALTTLSCYNNALTELDVRNNPALTRLECDNNALTELEVRNNPALTLLGCSSNYLTELDVSKNTALTGLYCNNNELTGLDVTNNPALTWLDCSNNYMTSTTDVTGWTSIPGLTLGSSFVFNPQNPLDITDKFTDPNFLAAVRTLVGKPTGAIYNTDVSGIATLNVSSKGITSLAGIEYFTGLTYLDCISNEITELDVSKNTALIYLACSSNKLTELDMTNNPALTELWCDYNELTGLNVTNNPALKLLVCFGNALTELDVRNNPALTSINCHSNELTGLDVRNNPALTSINCHSNGLTALDVTNNPVLRTINCADNDLTELDVTNNTALTYLDCSNNYMTSTADVIGWESIDGLSLGSTFRFDPQKPLDITDKFTDPMFLAEVRSLVDKPTDPIYNTDVSGIATLNVSGKGIASLAGIEYFTSLTELYCYTNALTELDVTNNPALVRLWCEVNALTELDVTGNPLLTYLNCTDNALTELNVRSNPALAQLYCYNNALTELDVTNNPELTYLYCDDNRLTSLDVTNNPALRTINCADNDLTELDVTNNTALTYLDCRDNYMTSTADVIGWTSIPGLYLGSTFIFDPQTPLGSIRITDKFTDPAFLTAVRDLVSKPTEPIYNTDVSGITTLYVSHGGIASLAGIEYFTSLTELYCYNNALTELDVSKNSALTILECQNNDLTELDVTNNSALTILECQNNDLTELDVTNNSALTMLDCQGNALTALGVSNNTSLTHLYCSANALTELDVTNKPALITLSCSANALTKLDVTNNTALTWLDCQNNYMTSTDDVIGWTSIPGLTLGSTFRFDPQLTPP